VLGTFLGTCRRCGSSNCCCFDSSARLVNFRIRLALGDRSSGTLGEVFLDDLLTGTAAVEEADAGSRMG
jgi:hypothetical protein